MGLLVAATLGIALSAKVDTEVVIIGGGVAGIATAAALTKLGIGPVVVLEAADRLGGRLEAVRLSPGAQLANVGAMWCHHAEGNPVARLAARHGCRTVPTSNADAQFFDASGARLPDALAAPTLARLRAVVAAFLRARDARGGADPRAPDMAAALRAHDRRADPRYAGGTAGAAPYSADERAYLELHAYRNIVEDLTSDLADLSADDYDRAEFGGFGRDVLVLDDFFGCVFAPLLEGGEGGHPVRADVRLGTAATAVRRVWTPWGPRVHVTTDAGTTVRARRAVLAVPLAVLKEVLGEPAHPAATVSEAEAAAFWRVERPRNPLRSLPRLDARTRRAIARIGVGRALRVALAFPGPPFWGAPVESLVLAGARGADQWAGRGVGSGQHLEFSVVPGDVSVLVAEADGAYATALTRLDDDALADALWRRLARVYGEDTVPRPSKIYARKFLADPLTAGSFSFSSVASDREADLAALGLGNGAVFLAGEHASALKGTVGGAMLSGWAAAGAVACSLGATRPYRHVDAELMRELWQPECVARFSGEAEPFDLCVGEEEGSSSAAFWKLYHDCRIDDPDEEGEYEWEPIK